MANKKVLAKIIREICDEEQIEYNSYSDDWFQCLVYNRQLKMYIYNFKFPNNNAAIEAVCNDKSALSDVLTKMKIPHIRHYYFSNPELIDYSPNDGIWHKLYDLLDKYGALVCKSNKGSGGRNMFRVRNKRELEYAVHSLFKNHSAMAVSPYYPIRNEYRCIVLNNEVELIYRKQRPYVIGDGKATVKTLLGQNSEFIDIDVDNELDITQIPDVGEKIEISWKHNLGQGAKPEIIRQGELYDQLSCFAMMIAKEIDINFASVDVVEIEGKGITVMEVNSGVMMESFAVVSEDNYYIAKEIYRKAVLSYFGLVSKYRTEYNEPAFKYFEKIAAKNNIEMIEDIPGGSFLLLKGKEKNLVINKKPFNVNRISSSKLCVNKSACSYFLERLGFHVPKQKYYHVKQSNKKITLNRALEDLKDPHKTLGFGYPLIIKPNSLSQGEGVFIVRNYEMAQIAIEKVMTCDEFFLLEELVEGNEYRIVVFKNRVIQAYRRIPFSVVGDGQSSIKRLIKRKIDHFAEYQRDKEIDGNDERIISNILINGYTEDSILEQNKRLILQDTANLSLGGESEDYINKISSVFKELAVNVAKCLGLDLCGIDIISDDLSRDDSPYSIIEVNSAPGLDNYIHDDKAMQEEYTDSLYTLILKGMVE